MTSCFGRWNYNLWRESVIDKWSVGSAGVWRLNRHKITLKTGGLSKTTQMHPAIPPLSFNWRILVSSYILTRCFHFNRRRFSRKSQIWSAERRHVRGFTLRLESDRRDNSRRNVDSVNRAYNQDLSDSYWFWTARGKTEHASLIFRDRANY